MRMGWAVEPAATEGGARAMARVLFSVIIGAFLLFGSPAFGELPSAETATAVETVAGESAEEAESLQCQSVSPEGTAAESDGGGCHGIVTCSFTVAGKIIALPFRVAGLVLGVLF